MGTPEKSSNRPSSKQEVHTMPAYSDWSSSMQAIYGAGAAPPFFASTAVSSPTPHPFSWGGQHHLMPPNLTEHRYIQQFILMVESMLIITWLRILGTYMEMKNWMGKPTRGRIMLQEKKATSGLSADSVSEGSSDASDDNNQDFSKTKKGSFDQMLVDGANAQINTVQPNLLISVAGNPVVSGPVTNLNIGMDVWKGSGSNRAGVSPTVVASSGVMSDQWVQDERELKRQKRKQSNRESARRSRLRKQAECEELQRRMDKLKNENHTLRDELQRLAEDCEKLTSENMSIKEELTKLYGPDAVPNFEE
ncbi:G-box binding factor [Castilleja foliolosa]|uniref:G-box binding factor n=1 Tax=Castilleja foliolosa TaxID=1961234 RepID=A0ABD3BNH4_9LAMI